jgi:hypothetical protein
MKMTPNEAQNAAAQYAHIAAQYAQMAGGVANIGGASVTSGTAMGINRRAKGSSATIEEFLALDAVREAAKDAQRRWRIMVACWAIGVSVVACLAGLVFIDRKWGEDGLHYTVAGAMALGAIGYTVWCWWRAYKTDRELKVAEVTYRLTK